MSITDLIREKVLPKFEKPSGAVLRHCAVCGANFMSRSARVKFCSNRCRQANKNAKGKELKQANCRGCGKAFETMDRRIRYCGKRCARRALKKSHARAQARFRSKLAESRTLPSQ